MKQIKAKMTLLGLRQNKMAYDLKIEATRLNKILNGWIKPAAKEVAKIKCYLKNRRKNRNDVLDEGQ